MFLSLRLGACVSFTPHGFARKAHVSLCLLHQKQTLFCPKSMPLIIAERKILCTFAFEIESSTGLFRVETVGLQCRIVSWCNGSTTDSGPVCQGSNPCETTIWVPSFPVGDPELFVALCPIKCILAPSAIRIDAEVRTSKSNFGGEKNRIKTLLLFWK